MEALLFMFNSMLIVLVAFMGLRDDSRPPGTPHTSLFRLRDKPDAPAKPVPKTQPATAAGWAEWDRPGRPPL